MIECTTPSDPRLPVARLQLVRGEGGLPVQDALALALDTRPAPEFLVFRGGAHRSAYGVAGPPAGGPARAAYDRGTSLAPCFARRARLGLTAGAYPLSPDSLGLDLAAGTVLPDLMMEDSGLLVASARVRTLFEAIGIEEVEWLPVQIEGLGVVIGDHAILHALGTAPVLDMARSSYDLDPSEPSQILLLQAAVLDAVAVPPGARLVRPSTLRRMVLFRADLVAAMRAAGLNAGEFVSLEDWDPLA